MKQQADQHRSERQFEEGDWVYLNLQQYHQSSMARSQQKLASKYYGPYPITRKVGAVA